MGSADASKKGSEKELESLMAKRDELRERLGDGVIHTSSQWGDFADQASDTTEAAIEATLRERDVAELLRISDMINAIQSGVNIKLCTVCNKEIPPARLRYVPGARECVDCKRKEEGETPRGNGSVKERWSLLSDGEAPDHLDQSDMVDD